MRREREGREGEGEWEGERGGGGEYVRGPGPASTGRVRVFLLAYSDTWRTRRCRACPALASGTRVLGLRV